MNAFAAPESRGELCFRTIASRAAAFAAVGFWAMFAVLSPATGAEPVQTADGNASASHALRPWTAAMPPPVILPRFGEVGGPDFAVAAGTADATLLHFFASWCEPCREELPMLKRLAERGGPGIRVIGVAVADNGMAVSRLVGDTGVTFPILLDRDRATARAWSISALPSTVVLDSQHRARLIVESDFAWDTIEPRALLDRLSPPAAHSSLARNVQQTTAIPGGQ